MSSQGDIKTSIMTLLISSIEFISWGTAKKYLFVESQSQIQDKIYVREVISCNRGHKIPDNPFESSSLST